ncbi:UNVERIFIED_CONTAM: hypothetical protein Slati_4415000 [Sesamum latifolium]|uniref:Reverse transcriptase Ty1/copia-type domain-containing protein n=1 Tax=Sesamum latifolium TaxID=2727402 RepID=A0AAW2SRN2_9LAMI
MAKSIRILLAIAAWYDYEIWQMDVKTAFLNGFIEEETFMDQPEGFTAVGEEQKNDYDPCIYKKISGSSVAYLVLYVDDIFLIRNDAKMLGNIKAWLSTQFSLKDMGEASYILGIKIYILDIKIYREMVSRGDCRMDRVSSAESTVDPLTKPMSQVAHTQHLDKMGLRSMGDWL